MCAHASLIIVIRYGNYGMEFTSNNNQYNYSIILITLENAYNCYTWDHVSL